jgi:Na+-translocating ferredoxin:NAD+ oxidoreductase RnfG subunit
MIIAIFSKMILTGDNVVFGILLIFFTVFAGLSLVFVFFNESLKEKRAKMNPALSTELSKAPETGKLLEEKPFEPISSVAENSTELLFVENKTTKIK